VQEGESEPELVPNSDQEVINLEHVLPQKPSPAWSHINSEIADDYCKRIGNMVLLKSSINAKAGNDSFLDKIHHYRESAYQLTSQVASYPAWGPDQIKKRQDQLAKLAVQTWPVTV
jgi:hypothetical protein